MSDHYISIPMTQQNVLVKEEVDVTGCVRCGNYLASDIFQLCGHPNSEYKIGIKVEHHTCQHMRSTSGGCGPERRLGKNV